ncbi:helix-turn-helix domain-containing protein, partial [Bacillus mobilis]
MAFPGAIAFRRDPSPVVEKACKVFRMPEKPLEAWISFGKDLRRFRRQRGATLDQLAERTGYGASTISKYENAYRCPKKDFVD